MTRLPAGDEFEFVLDGLDEGTAGRGAAVWPGVDAPEGVPGRVGRPAAASLLSLAALRNAAKRRLARVRVTPREHSREYSWAHARVQEPDGSTREGWLRAGEGMAFTATVAAEVASRLSRNEGRPGAYTPGALFGPELAVKDAGAQAMSWVCRRAGRWATRLNSLISIGDSVGPEHNMTAASASPGIAQNVAAPAAADSGIANRRRSGARQVRHPEQIPPPTRELHRARILEPSCDVTALASTAQPARSRRGRQSIPRPSASVATAPSAGHRR